VARHLVALLDDGRRVSDAAYDGVVSSTLYGGGFSLIVGARGPRIEQQSGLAGSELAELALAALDDDEMWLPLLRALREAGVQTDASRLRAVERDADINAIL
jgi:hypothetical protein